MCKRPGFLISIVLVLSLSVAVQAQTTIDVNNYSFEYYADGNQVSCHGGIAEDDPYPGVMAWSGGAELGAANPDWSGMDVNCGPGTCPPGENTCKDWFVVPDGNTVCYMDDGTFIFQLTDADITAGYKYTLTFDGMTWYDEAGWTQPIRGSFYYLADVCTPDVCHIELSQTVHVVTGYEHASCAGEPDCRSDWEYDLTVSFVAETGKSYLGEKLGIKLGSPWAGDYPGSSWAFVDDVRLAWDWATEAYEPSPEDGAELVTKNPQLTWKPGVYADDHEVYFGDDETAVANADNTDTTGIYQSTQDPCEYTPAGPLELGKTYYWKITEVNTGYVGPLTPPWEGDVWSFRVEGHAYDPSPADGESDVEFLGLALEWTAGSEAERHMLYFGTDAQSVEDATTSSAEFEANLPVATVSYAVPQLITNKRYYWRLDELSNGQTHTVTGDVWMFQVGLFLVVDDFESYTNQTDLWNVWDDYWVNGSDGEIWQENDANLIRVPGSQAVKLEFENIRHSGAFPGSWFDVQDLSELSIGSDWTIGGVKALFLYVRGDPCNAQVVPQTSKGAPIWDAATPWIELEDTSSNTGYVVHPNPYWMGYDSWDEWNIDLGIFDACGVDLTAIDRFTIGIGGQDKTEQSSPMSDPGYIYVDDIRLYPPRCRPAESEAVGDFTGAGGEPDCNVDLWDVNFMSTDWLIADGCFPTLTQHGTITMLAGSPNWTSGHVGTGSLGFDPNITIDVCDPRLIGLNNMSITLWAQRKGEQEAYVGIITCREKGVEDSTELAGGSKGDSVGYCWNQIAKTWQFSSGLDVPDGEWTLMAMAVDPCGCSLYAGPAGGTLTSARQYIDLPPLLQFDEKFWIGRGRDTSRYYLGNLDDIRIFARTLDVNEMTWLHTGGVTGTDPCCPAYHYKLDDASGLTATDDGCGAVIYKPVLSNANLTDPEPVNSRFVNMADYGILADNWMSQHYWP